MNKHLNTQERAHREFWGFERNEMSAKRASTMRPKQKRATVKASEKQRLSAKRPKETSDRESDQMKNERAQSDRNKRATVKATKQKTNERKAIETNEQRESYRTKNERAQSEQNRKDRA